MLDAQFPKWPGVDQSTVADLVADGLHYRCFVWINRADCRVEAMCEVTHPDGASSVVFHNFVDTATSTAISNTAGYPLDCPKIIAVGATFLVHWLASDDEIPVGEQSVNNWQLYRASMDMEAFDASIGGWTNYGALAVYIPYALYDVAPLIGSDTDFLLARSITDGETIRVERYDGFALIDTDWQEDLIVAHEGRVLAVYGHETDDDVLVTYERTGEGETEGGSLWTWHLDGTTGTQDGSDVQTFTVYSFTDPHGPFTNSPVLTITGAFYVNAKHCRVASQQVAVVAESVLLDLADAGLPYSFVHHLSWRRLDTSDAGRLGNEWWCPHLSMVSAPFAYDNGTSAAGTQPNVFVVASYKSIYSSSDWEQATIWCLDLNFPRWLSEDSGQQMRPRPVATLSSVGIPDARVSAWHPESEDLTLSNPPLTGGPIKRCNHVSSVSGAPPFGPLVKTRTVSVGIWAQMGNVGTDPSPSAIAADQSADIEATTLDDDGKATAAQARGGEFQPENLGATAFIIHIEDPWTIFRDSTDPTQPVDNFSGPYPRSSCQAIEVGRGLAIFGGTPYYYDGERVGELGFPYGPEILLLVGGEASGGATGDLTPLTTYRYYAVATRRDKQGQVHRSRPSRIASVTLEGAENAVQFRIRTQVLSLWDSTMFYPSAPATQFEIFRTEGDGAVFYRVFGAREATPVIRQRPRDTPINNPLAIWGYVDFEDGLSDDDLILQGFAPFSLGEAGFIEITPETVPALSCPAVWQGRLWGADTLDSSLLWYSDEILPDFGSDYYRAPEFSSTNTFRIDGLGDVAAIQAMGDALWVFTSSSIACITGNPNDGTGQGADMRLETVHQGIGCVEPRSVCLGPVGILFQSQKGITWLDRQGSLDYLTAGANVEDDVRDAGNVRSATLMETSNQVLVACNGRPIVTWTTTIEFSIELPGEVFSFTLTGVGAPGLIATTESEDGDTGVEVGGRLATQILAAIADRSTMVFLYLVDADVVGNDLVITWAPDVEPSYSVSPDMDAVDTSTIAAQPRVLALDYLQKRWSRWDLPDVSATQRLNEVVSGCAWEGNHAVLQQGGLRLQYPKGHENEFADDSSVGAQLPVRIDVKTAPIHLAGIGGWKRLRRIYVQTSKPNASQFNCDLDFYTSGNYDLPDDLDEDITVSTVTPAGLEVCPRLQKLQAVGIRIHEPVGVVDLENVTIYSITLLAGIKRGLVKRNDAQRGTT